jgi:short-chain Z-isoprenyl diphosphate synthase
VTVRVRAAEPRTIVREGDKKGLHTMSVGVEQAPERSVHRGRRLSRSLVRAARALWRLALSPVYRLYTHRLRDQVLRRPLPRHVAVILDGNRRWASSSGLREPGAGHQAGADKLDALIAWCGRLDIPQLTVWALARENLARPSEELEALLDVIAQKLDTLGRTNREHPARIRILGRRADLPEQLRRSVEEAERATAANDGLQLNIALGYSGRDELVDAVRELVSSLAHAGYAPSEMVDLITADSLAQHLYMAGEPDPDLIVRTSGEQRLSGFLPWQGTHSELYFTDVYWPAFRELDLLRAIRSFQQRERRFGR